MKTTLIALFLSISACGFSQGKIYIITEQYSAMNNTSIDKIIVTDPSGETTTYNITHFLKDPAVHDREFNKIINEISAKGYQLLNASPNAHGDMIEGINIFTRTWFLKQS